MTQIKRLLAQFGFFFLQNPLLNNFISGKIYGGKLKIICSPGLNCYSCPAAVTSCPVGAAQFFFAGVKHSAGFYITGFLLAAGVVFGRFICGYACPMGLLQDLTYKIKTPKLILRFRFLKYIKYAVLVVFVILLPMTLAGELSGLGQPWFCKYICPSGTLFGAAPLLAANGSLRELIGAQFIFKISAAAGLVIISAFVFRVFCRVLCPLGALYSLMNKIAFIRIDHDKSKCGSCGACAGSCGIKINPASRPNDPECVRCGKCVNACGKNALVYSCPAIKPRIKNSGR